MLRYLPLVLRNSFRNRRRSALTVLSIAASFCLLGVLLAMYHVFFFTAPTWDQALRLIVRNRVSIANTLPLSYRERIRRVKGVREVTVFQWFGGTYRDSREMKYLFSRFAVEPGKLFTVSPQYRIPEEQKRAFERERTACVASRGVAERLNFRLGDRVTLTGDIYPVTLELTVRGIYEADRDDDNLFFSYDYLSESLSTRRRDFISMFVLIADHPDSVPRIAEEVDRMFENSPAETKTETEKAFELGFLSYLGDVKLLLISVCGALTFTVLLVSGNTMAMAARERVREVGILKTLGYTPGAVLSLILGESVLIALTGGGLGLALAGGIVSALRRTPAVFFNLKGMTIPPWILGASLLLAVLVGLASSVVPAWNAARRPIVACLRFTD